MEKSVKDLQCLMVDQIRRRGFYPKDQQEVLLHITEEVGELYQAVRKDYTTETISYEVVDIFWHLLRFCEFRGIDLEKAFLEKLAINETRPLGPHS